MSADVEEARVRLLRTIHGSIRIVFVLAAPSPPELLLAHLLPRRRRVGVDEAGRLVHRLVPCLRHSLVRVRSSETSRNTPMNLAPMNEGMASISTVRRNAIVRPGRHPTVPRTLMAGIEYSFRTLSIQSATG